MITDNASFRGDDDLGALVRTIPDFPRTGIMFRDISTLVLNSDGFRISIERLAAIAPANVDLVAGIEARGFIFSSALALVLGKGLLMIRKDGKLPSATIAEDYALEYSTDRIAMHADACVPGQRVLLVDDLIATGGTAMAAVRLLRKVGAEVVGASFVIDLPKLKGVEKLREAGVSVTSLLHFDDD